MLAMAGNFVLFWTIAFRFGNLSVVAQVKSYRRS
jgi:hypothetical protein